MGASEGDEIIPAGRGRQRQAGRQAGRGGHRGGGSGGRPGRGEATLGAASRVGLDQWDAPLSEGRGPVSGLIGGWGLCLGCLKLDFFGGRGNVKG